MSTMNDETNVLPICEDCVFRYIRIKKENAEYWIDIDTGEHKMSADYKAVCAHAEPCKRAYGKR